MAARVGVVSVGGRGRRFGEPHKQKCLVLIEGKRLFEYPVSAFVACGVESIILLTGFHHEQVTQYLPQLQSKFPGCIIRCVYGGTEGEISALCRLKLDLNEDFLYSEGNVIYPVETVNELLSYIHTTRNQQILMAMTVSPDLFVAPGHVYVTINNNSKRIDSIGVTESKRKALGKVYVHIGLRYYRPAAFAWLEQVGKHRPPSDFIRMALQHNLLISALVTSNPWFALHTREDLQKWQTSALHRRILPIA